MSCNTRYATGWQFSAFFCRSGFRVGLHVGAGGLVLSDPQADFINLGVEPNVGMVLYNVTAGTSGEVTAVTKTTLTTAAVVWAAGNTYRIAAISGAEIASIELALDITAGDIHAALLAVAACDCDLGSGIADYLAKINIIEAMAFTECPCAKMSDEKQAALLEWATSQLERVRSGEIPVCEGDSGRYYPAVGNAQYSHTIWTEQDMIINKLLKGP